MRIKSQFRPENERKKKKKKKKKTSSDILVGVSSI